jgi:lipopolysaccharide/colanic/teichoic acid biosynthesis glycosyltransferase
MTHALEGTQPAGAGSGTSFSSSLNRPLAAVVLLLTLPLWLLAAVLVGISLGRPLLFHQVRTGLEGKPFVISKFRTMHDGRGPGGGLLPDSSRETPVTRYMRRVRLDELPQLLSILRGDMAFIGPRPLLPETIQAFGEMGRLRCRVRPGVSGWAQVNGNTHLNDREKLALDLWYVRNRSFRLDLFILLMTARVSLLGERVNQHNVGRACEALGCVEMQDGRGTPVS